MSKRFLLFVISLAVLFPVLILCQGKKKKFKQLKLVLDFYFLDCTFQPLLNSGLPSFRPVTGPEVYGQTTILQSQVATRYPNGIDFIYEEPINGTYPVRSKPRKRREEIPCLHHYSLFTLHQSIGGSYISNRTAPFQAYGLLFFTMQYSESQSNLVIEKKTAAPSIINIISES